MATALSRTNTNPRDDTSASGVIFFETLRRNWKATAGWAASMAILALYVVAAVPDTKALQMYGSMFADTPKFAMLILGGDAAALASPAGLYGAFFFGWIMLVLATYGVMCGLSITANDEDRGILDMMVALPVARWRIVIEKFAAYTVNTCVIAMVAFLGIWLSTANSTVFNLDVGTILSACLNLVPPILLTMAFTAFVAAVVRRRTVAMGIAGGFVVVSYMIDVVGSQIEGGALSKFSYFHYYNGMMSLVRGADLGSMLFLLVIAAVLGAGTVYMFQRRDVGL